MQILYSYIAGTNRLNKVAHKMNHIMLKELHRTALISKLSGLSPTDIKSINDTNDTYSDILKLIVNNDMCYIQNENVKCYIFKYSNIIYIGIHSTIDYSVKNKLTQFKDDIYIHRGVYNAFVSIEEKLHYNILNLDKKQCVKKIYVMGYGVAGAIATVVSATLADKFKNMYIVSCYTFGSPPVGNKSFRKWFLKNVSCNYRVVTENDSNKYYFKYHHVSDELRLTADNIVNITHIDTSLLKRIKLLMSFKKQLFDNYMPVDKYIEYLRTILHIYKSNIYRINQVSGNNEEHGKTLIEIPNFHLKPSDSFKSNVSISTSSSPIFTSIKSPKSGQKTSPHRPGPSPHRHSSAVANLYAHQGPLTDEFVMMIIQKLDNANYTLSKFLEQNLRRTSSSNTILTSATTTPASITTSGTDDTTGEKMFVNTMSPV